MTFRYGQFCPVARAAEFLGGRWTLLIARDLLIGPQRFSDLRRRLAGVSSSVLSQRLTSLETRGLVQRRRLDPPAPATVYELTGAGRAIEPVLRELTRFGLQFLGPPLPGDHFELDWPLLAMRFFARSSPTPPVALELRLDDGEREICIGVRGGPDGTTVGPLGERPAQATLRAPPIVMLAMMGGALDPREAARDGTARLDGDAEAAAHLSDLFDVPEATVAPGLDPSAPSHPTGE